MRDDIIWELRSDKVRELIKSSQRLDGRALYEYRPIKIETDFSKNAHGSCRVVLGETDVIAGVKMDVAEPYPDTPDEGSITVGVEFMPMASPVFEPGPPDQNATELARVVDRCIRESKAIDFKKLCIEEGEKAWFVFIDIYVANDSGNLFDASSLAALGALLNTKIPKLEDDEIVKDEFVGKLEVAKRPLLTTFAKINGKLLLDPAIAEEKAMDARISIGTTEEKLMSALQKGGPGSFTQAEIEQCIDLAFEKSAELRKLLKVE